MRINLTEIPEEGRTYLWNNKTAELNAQLADLVGSIPHEAEFFIKPMNTKDFEMSGVIKTEVPDDCSRCGIDFNFKVNERFKAILIPKMEIDRTGKYAKVNHVSEAIEYGPSVSEYTGTHFEMGEYLHEIVALAAPFNPAPPENKDGDCTLCLKHVRGKLFVYDEAMPVDQKPENPFQALKNLKLN